MLPWHLRDLLGLMVLCGSSRREVVGTAAPGFYPLVSKLSVRTGFLALVLPCLVGRMGREGLSFISRWDRYTGMLTAEMSMVWLQPADTPTQMLLVPSQAAEKHFTSVMGCDPHSQLVESAARPTYPSFIGCCQCCFLLICQEQTCSSVHMLFTDGLRLPRKLGSEMTEPCLFGSHGRCDIGIVTESLKNLISEPS